MSLIFDTVSPLIREFCIKEGKSPKIIYVGRGIYGEFLNDDYYRYQSEGPLSIDGEPNNIMGLKVVFVLDRNYLAVH